MLITDVIRRSGRSLKSAKMRTILTSLAIAVGGFTLTATLAAGNGIREYTDNLISSNFDPAELIVGRDPEVSNTGQPDAQPKEYDKSMGSLSMGQGGNLQIKQVTDKDIASLKRLPYAEDVREYVQLDTEYITRDGQKRYTTSAEPYNGAQKPEVEAGSLPNSGGIPTGQIVLPEAYVSLLGFENANDVLGETITVGVRKSIGSDATSQQSLLTQLTSGSFDANSLFETHEFQYRVAAVSKRSPTSMTFGALPVLLSTKDTRTIYDFTTKGTPEYGKYMYVFMRVKDGTNEAKIQNAQKDLKAKDYYTLSIKEIQKSITQIVNVLQALVGVFGMITLLASVFGIINTQYISVLERTREIGLMKALGMRNKDVRKLFMFEAAWIGLLGGLIGSALAYGIGMAMNPWITRKLDLGEGNSLLMFDFAQVAALIIGLVVIAMLAGYFPARKAAKLDPIEALRTE
jgi:putative ABC transport system permease protein